jgi:hypothetical protein
VRARHAQLHALALVAEAVRQRDHARHDVFGELGHHAHLARARAQPHVRAVHHAQARGVVRVQHGRAAVAALHQALAVVQPAVVAAHVASADEHQAALVVAHAGAQALHVGQHGRGRQLHIGVLLGQALAQAGLERAEVLPVWVLAQLLQREPVLQQVGARAVGARAQAHVQHALGPCLLERAQPQHFLVHAPPAQRRQTARQPQVDLPVVQGAPLGREGRQAELGRVAHREDVQRQVVVWTLERRKRRQDQVRVARGLVDVRVHADEQVQLAERAVQLPAVGRGQHGVARHGEEPADLPGALGEDLFGQHRHRQLTAELGQPAHTAAPAAVAAAPHAEAAHGLERVERGLREHDAALAVHVARDGVERIDQPRAQAAEALGGSPHAPVHGCPPRREQARGDAAQHVWRDAGVVGCERGRKLLGHGAQLVEPARQPLEVAEPHGAPREHLVHQRQQEQRVAAWPDEVVLSRAAGALRAARVQQDHLPAAPPDGVEALADAGGAHQAAVAGQRVGAQHQQEVRAVHVGHGRQELVPEHVVRREHVRQLVHAGGREAVLAAQRPQDGGPEQHGPHVVHVGVAQVRRHRVVAVPPLQAVDALGRLVQRLVPRDGHEAAALAAHGLAHAVRVVVQVGERGGLRADVALAERVPLVTAGG